MNRERWREERARRDEAMPERIRELATIEAENLPRKPGDMLGSLQWADARTGKVRRWVVRIGKRRGQITLEPPGQTATNSRGWSTTLTQLRKHLV